MERLSGEVGVVNFLYDRSKYPSSWDFLQWLVNAEIANTVAGAKSGDLKVVFRGEHREDGLARPVEQRQAIFENVMRPSVALMAAEELPETEGMEFADDVPYLTRFVVDHTVHNGGDVPYFRVPLLSSREAVEYLNGRKPLVITLREARYYPSRNSNLEAWKEFARTCGEDVIFVRDTSKADEPLIGFETCPRASKDLWFRLALMHSARCNLMVQNGPWVFGLYSPFPWLSFGQLHPEIPEWKPGSPSWWEYQMGVPEGGQFPWSHENQRLIWRDDSLESIRDAWKQYLPVIDNPPAYKLGEIKTKGVWSDEERLANCLRNMSLVKERVPELPAHNGTAIIACYGPSLNDTYKVIRDQRNTIPGATLVSVSGAHDFLVNNRLKPNIHVECDPRPHKAAMLKKPQHKTRYFLASCVHPDMTEKLKRYNMALWHLMTPGAMKLWEHEKDALLTSGGGSVGLRCVNLMYQLGYRTFIIHGMDCSFRGEVQHASTHLGKKQHPRRVKVGDRWFDTASIQVAYARQFFDMEKKMREHSNGQFRIGFMGDGMLQAMAREANRLGELEEKAA